MSVLGPLEIQNFLKRIDEHSLLDICTDILAIEGHKNIRIMDGPGDGQRDIHSVDADGNQCLTQSKYHSNFSQSVSAQELGEVILGMVRFGYKHGIFITSTKISPQAKRDCLNSFPGFSIDFLEGRDIAHKVFDNLVLKAIWIDNSLLDKVSYSLIYPFIIRDLETDRPIQFMNENSTHPCEKQLLSDRSVVQISYQRMNSSNRIFKNYRSPKRKTTSEMGTSNIFNTGAIISGIIHLDNIDSIFESVNYEVINEIIAENPDKKHMAIVFGSPSLTTYGGELSGKRIELAIYKSKTIVIHDKFIGTELEWIVPKTDTKEWVLPRRPSVLQSDWIRWYNSEFDMCLDIYVLCPPSENAKWQFSELNEYFINWWGKSFFMLVPNKIILKWDTLGSLNLIKLIFGMILTHCVLGCTPI